MFGFLIPDMAYEHMADAPAQENPDVQEAPQVQATQEPQVAHVVAELTHEKKYNICAFLQDDIVGRDMFVDIIVCLHNLRIRYAISSNVPVHFSVICPFWESARYVDAEKHIVAEVQKKTINIDADVIRRVLWFFDTINHPGEFDKTLARGLFRRLSYKDNLDRS